MKAVGYAKSLPIDDAESLMDIELPQPVAEGRDLLVRVKAIAANPVDAKIRTRAAPAQGEYRVLGWDAVGEVVAVGDAVKLYKAGDKVFYAGELNRQGCNAEFQLVDERLVGRKPASISDSEAAALPLTTITAWELLFKHLAVTESSASSDKTSNDIILVIGAAGGVGSILIQLIKQLTGAKVIATASREKSQAWIKKLGADFVIDHTKPLTPQVKALGIESITHVASLTHTDSYFDECIELLEPFGKIVLIDDPTSIDVMKLKPKSLSLHIEFMFARSTFKVKDMSEQGKLLNRLSALVDEDRIKATMATHLGTINAENLRVAHQTLESGKSMGKIVLEGF